MFYENDAESYDFVSQELLMGKGSVYTENGERKYVNKSERLLFHRATQDLPIEKKCFA